MSRIERVIMAKITVKSLTCLWACKLGITAFREVYPEGLALSDWTQEEQLRVLKTDLRKYLGWGSRAGLIPMLPMQKADLTGANLSWADLPGADLTGAYLLRAKLRRAKLTGAKLNYADLTGADLSNASLRRADLSGANLTNADLSGANLTGANLTGANLSGAYLKGAYLGDWERGQDGIAQRKA